MPGKTIDELEQDFLEKWPEALNHWSKYTQLCLPRFCHTPEECKKEHLTDSFAMIRFADQAIVIDLATVLESNLEDYALEILAHEIGHHIYAPANLGDQARLMARMRKALPSREQEAPFVGNLYTDLLINDRLQRSGSLRMGDIYKHLAGDAPAATSKMWTFYMRIYEILWSVQKGTLATGVVSSSMEGDAYLGARLVRSFSKDWLDGGGRFAALCLPYLLDNEDKDMKSLLRGILDSMSCSHGGQVPPGLAEEDPDELNGAVHPADDKDLTGFGRSLGELPQITDKPDEEPVKKDQSAQYREPFEYGEILKSLGITLDEHDITVSYYKERATPHLVRFPERIMPESSDPLPEGTEAWDIGSPIESIDWMQTVLMSPHIIPSFSTVQRVWGTCDGADPEKRPVDLDIYIDCSGSMPNPQVRTSYLALAGVIIALSALRTGACVQATLWSGPGVFETTGGFLSDELRILRIITGYLSGSTAFPLNVMRDTYQNRQPGARDVHIMVISDEGADTMFCKDEQGNAGAAIIADAIKKARGGGSLVLNLVSDWRKSKEFVEANRMGYDVYAVTTWEELEVFAREFSARQYAMNPSR